MRQKFESIYKISIVDACNTNRPVELVFNEKNEPRTREIYEDEKTTFRGCQSICYGCSGTTEEMCQDALQFDKAICEGLKVAFGAFVLTCPVVQDEKTKVKKKFQITSIFIHRYLLRLEDNKIVDAKSYELERDMEVHDRTEHLVISRQGANGGDIQVFNRPKNKIFN